MRRLLIVLAWSLIGAASAAPAVAGSPQDRPAGGTGQAPGRSSRPPAIADRTQNMKKLDGFFPLYWDDAAGTLFMEISRFNQDVLYLNGLAAGLGSNDIGLDRAQLGGTRVVKFQRIGPEDPDDRAELRLSRDVAQRGRAQGGRGRVRAVGHLGLHRRGRDRRPRARRSRPTSSCAMRTASRAGSRRRVPLRSHAQCRLHGEHARVSEEHRNRSDDDADDRRRRAAGAADRGRSAGASPT